MADASHLGLIGTQPGYSEALWLPPCWIWRIDMIDRADTAFMVHSQLRNPLEKLKAKIKELARTEQEYASKSEKLVIRIEEVQNEIKLFEGEWKRLKVILLLQHHSQSVDQDNQARQAGISTLRAEEWQKSFAELKKSFSERNRYFDSCSFEREVNMFIILFEESTSNFLNTLKSCAIYLNETFRGI